MAPMAAPTAQSLGRAYRMTRLKCLRSWLALLSHWGHGKNARIIVND
jgi:hypothetical protein